MKGTIIVGKASKQEETKTVSHHKIAEEAGDMEEDHNDGHGHGEHHQ